MLKIYILAGGFGTRLSKVIKDVPKPMAPIGNIPFLEYQINMIEKSIPEYEMTILTHHKSQIIEEYFRDNTKVKVIREHKPLGTGGAIKNAIEILKYENNEPILVLNGDSYINTDFNKFIKNSHNNINILCTYQEDCERSSTIEIKNNIIKKFNKQGIRKKNSYISTGCYYFKDTLCVREYPDEIFMIEDFFEKIYNDIDLYAYTYTGDFIDIGVPKDYIKFCELMKNED